MSSQRKIVFENGNYYHVFNRGIDRRPTFTNRREYTRAMELLSFYQYSYIPLRYSRYNDAPENIRDAYLGLMKESGKKIEVVAYCLMPNHFHLLLRQKEDLGISTYISNFINAYTKYFNTKYKRLGPLFQGIFRAVYVESDEQLLHLTRYIHLNPVASSLITSEQLKTFEWSSYPFYIERSVNSDLIEEETISMINKMIPDYKDFVKNQISYAKELEKIKHMTFE